MADGCLFYYITDRSQFRGDESNRRRALLAKIAEAAQWGVDYIQLREKDLTARELENLAREVVATVRQGSASTRVLINSRTDIALATEADGVHLRADDISPADVRRILQTVHPQPTRHFALAVSCHSNEDVVRADVEAVDFAVFAPVFGKSKVPESKATGIEALREASRGKIPVLALGGVSVENAASCLDAGAAGVAGIRLFQDNKIADVVRALRAA